MTDSKNALESIATKVGDAFVSKYDRPMTADEQNHLADWIAEGKTDDATDEQIVKEYLDLCYEHDVK